MAHSNLQMATLIIQSTLPLIIHLNPMNTR